MYSVGVVVIGKVRIDSDSQAFQASSAFSRGSHQANATSFDPMATKSEQRNMSDEHVKPSVSKCASK